MTKGLLKNLRRAFGLFILIPLSFVVIRNKRKWAFGSNMGFTGNAKHLFIFTKNRYAGIIDSVWVTDKRAEYQKLKHRGMPVVYKWSFMGLLTALTAKVYLYNSYVSDINEYTYGHVTRVNLWHGVALKHIERTKTRPEKKYITRNPFLKLRYFRFLIRPTFVLTSSPTETELFARSFAVEASNCIEGTYPRNEILHLSKAELNDYIKENEYDSSVADLLERIKGYDHCIIYMPTWRDSGRNFLDQINLDLTLLNETLKTIKACMIFKLHPATKLDVDLSLLSNIIMIGSDIDIYPILPFTDCLLTDYSSIYFDYMLMKDRRIILYIPDFKEYTSGDRDFAFPFEESVEGEKIYDFEELIHSLRAWPETIKESDPVLMKKFWDPKVIGNEALVEYIASQIGLKLDQRP